MPIQTSSITTETNGDLSLDPNGTGKVKLTDLAGTSTEQLAVDSAGNIEKLNATALPELEKTVDGDVVVVQAGTSRDTIVAGDIYRIDATSIGGTPTVNPTPADVTAVPAFEGGTGTLSDPFIVSPATVAQPGGTATSAQLITVTSVAPGAFQPQDISSPPALGRFQQSPEVIAIPNGSASFNLIYTDAPATSIGQGQTYNGLIKIGSSTVYFSWAVSQAANASIFGPTSQPTASPASVNFPTDGKFGTVSSTWADGSTTLQNVDGNIVFGVNGGTLDSSSKAVVNGNTVSVAFTDNVVTAAANGDTITGVLESVSGGYYSPFSLIKDNVPGTFSIPALSSQATNAVVTSFGPAPDGFNAPTTLTSAVGGANALTSISVSVGGAAFTSSYPITVNPGDLIQVRGTTGSSSSTVYSAIVTIGGVAATFAVQTGATAAEVATPQIVSPPNFGGSDQPTGVTVTSTPIALVGGGSVTHQSSSWQAYKALPGAAPMFLKSGTITNVFESGSNTIVTLDSSLNFSNFIPGNQVQQNAGYSATSSTITNVVTLPSAWNTNGQAGTIDLVACAASSSLFVGVGNQVAATSSDGVSFTASTQSLIRQPTGLAVGQPSTGSLIGQTVFVVVMKSGSSTPRSAYSTNGVTWNSGVSISDDLPWSDVAFGNGRFVAVGSDTNPNNAASSTDGINWSIGQIGAQTRWSSIAYGNNTFVAVSSTGSSQVATSPDGVTWTLQTPPATEWNQVEFGDGRFVATSNNNQAAKRAMTSIDGINWVETTPPAATKSLVYGAGTFVAIQQDGSIMFTYDGLTWTESITNIPSSNVNTACYGNDRFVAFGDAGATWWSYTATEDQIKLTAADTTDLSFMKEGSTVQKGGVWSQGIFSPSFGNFKALLYLTPTAGKYAGQSIWLACADNGPYTILVSTDGIIWEGLTSLSNSDKYTSIAEHNGNIVAISNEKALVSSDVTNWIEITAPANLGKFITATSTGRFYTSLHYYSDNNGFTWIKNTAAAAANVDIQTGIVFGNGTLVGTNAATATTYSFYSTDNGITWTGGNLGYGNWNALGFGNGRFVVAGSNSQNFNYSNDGISWISSSDTPGKSCQALNYGNGLWIATTREVNNGSSTVISADNGVNWTQGGPDAYLGGDYFTIAYGGDKWVMAGGGAKLEYSYAGTGVGINDSITNVSGNTVRVTGGDWTGSDGTSSGTVADRQTKVGIVFPLALGKGTLLSLNSGTNQMTLANVRSQFIPNTNGGSGSGTPTNLSVIDESIPGTPEPPTTEPPSSDYSLIKEDLASTTELQSWTPTGGFPATSTCFVRVKYTESGAASSDYSDWSGFDTV